MTDQNEDNSEIDSTEPLNDIQVLKSPGDSNKY